MLCDADANANAIHRYTSLGSTYNTSPNPALLIEPECDTAPPALDPAPVSTHASEQLADVGGADTPVSTTPKLLEISETSTSAKRFRPAYELLDGSLERAGRHK
jgi:FAD synthetase